MNEASAANNDCKPQESQIAASNSFEDEQMANLQQANTSNHVESDGRTTRGHGQVTEEEFTYNTESETEPEDEQDNFDKDYEPELNAGVNHGNPVPKPKQKIKAIVPRGPRPKNAKEYVQRVIQPREEAKLKKHIRELLKSRSGKRGDWDRNLEIQPPKAKKPRVLRKSSAEIHLTHEATSNEVASTGALPDADMQRVTVTSRQKQLTTKKNQGTNNRRNGTQKQDLIQANRIFGVGKVECYQGASGNYNRLKGMRSKLYEWQLTAAAWQVLRETLDGAPYGGILADNPGMGKTLVMLACIVGNPPNLEDTQEFCRATLIVLPKASIVTQWRSEIAKHIISINSNEVYVYKRRNHKVSGGNMSGYKIVLTTYQELLGYPQEAKLAELRSRYPEDEDGFRKAIAGIAGEVFGVRWYRLVLDEGHEIKNPLTKTFQACYGLTSKYVWVLSATPLINRGTELFPYMKLLRVEGIETQNDFVETYLEAVSYLAVENFDCVIEIDAYQEDAAVKLDALVSVCTYRRTQNDEFLGEKILKGLKPFESEEKWVDLSPTERFLYDKIAECYDDSSPQSQRQLVISRQRQMISHPYDIEMAFRKDFPPEVIEKMRTSFQVWNGQEHDTKDIVGPDNLGASSRFEQDVDPDEDLFVSNNEHHNDQDLFCLSNLLRYTYNEIAWSIQTCGVCKREHIPEPWVIDNCNHKFCYACLSQSWRAQVHATTCPQCSTPYNRQYGAREVLTLTVMESKCDKLDEAEAAAQLSAANADTLVNKRKKKKMMGKAAMKSRDKTLRLIINRKYGADANGVLPGLGDDDMAFIKIGMLENDGDVPLGAKLVTAMNEILELRERLPNEKVIVFHEFTKTANILGAALNRRNIPFVYLNGKVTTSDKEKAIKAFKTNPDIKILISSFKVGGQALNLTEASQIIRIDSWWNQAADQQADGRVNRMGQTKNTRALAIKAYATIDHHIMTLQQEKSKDIAHMLQDDEHETKLLSNWEIMRYTAPEAYGRTTRRLIAEIQAEDAAKEALDAAEQDQIRD